jgi:FKBP-type peptidyl-prolyl cis-trans isomerase FklB
MRLLLTIVVVSGLMITPCLAEELSDLGHEVARVNYSVGYQIGIDFKGQEVEINPDALGKGIQDALSGEKALMTPEEQRAALADLQRKMAAQKGQDDGKKSRE